MSPAPTLILENRAQLITAFSEAASPPEKRHIGLEIEFFALDPVTGSPIPHEGPCGIGALLSQMADRYKWEKDLEGEHVIALRRDGESVTLEPGGQVELSSAPRKTLTELDEDQERFCNELRSVAQELGFRVLATGCQPFATIASSPWMPKRRYTVMREVLSQTGQLGHHMMKGTAAVQTSLDYSDEADVTQIFRITHQLAPIAVALFGASPIAQGKETGALSHRSLIWLDTDPHRCGAVPGALEGSLDFSSYTEYCLDVPMFFILRDGHYLPTRGLTFDRFLREGFEGHQATWSDWDLQLSTIFPHARMKSFIEIRSADGQTPQRALAVSAFWCGLIYDATARNVAVEISDYLSTLDHLSLYRDAAIQGLHAQAGKESLAQITSTLLQASRDGLSRIYPEEARYLDPICELVLERNMTPAQEQLEIWRTAENRLNALLDAYGI